MAARFVALPVAQGDAFLFEREGRRVLIDGGKSSRIILNLLAAEKVEHIDVVVCTHNDKDHAEGVAALLESDAVSVGEVWLPGRWSERLVDMCRSTPAFVQELHNSIEKTKITDLEDNTAAPRLDPPAASTSSDPSIADPDAAHAASDIVEAIDSLDERTHPFFEWPWAPGLFDAGRWKLWVECLTAADRIRRIAKGARDAGAKIRWFDYEEFSRTGKPSGGMPNLLLPVNAVELTPRVAKTRVTALDFLRLSVANRESLVFHAPAPQGGGDVLFSADSDLAFPLPPMGVAVVTSPHHGSDANAAAYVAVKRLGAQVTWVRSDGRFQKRPGQSYLQQKGAAYCTRCRGSTSRGQAVRFDEQTSGASATWAVSDPTIVSCHCT